MAVLHFKYHHRRYETLCTRKGTLNKGMEKIANKFSFMADNMCKFVYNFFLLEFSQFCRLLFVSKCLEKKKWQQLQIPFSTS